MSGAQYAHNKYLFNEEVNEYVLAIAGKQTNASGVLPHDFTSDMKHS